MRKTFVVALVAALAVAAFAVPAMAAQQFTTVRATLEPAGDPDGTGSVLLGLDAGDEAVCYRIQTQNLTTPITRAAIVSAETGEVAVELLVIDRGPELVECVSVSRFQGHGRRKLRRIGKDPGGYFLEL